MLCVTYIHLYRLQVQNIGTVITQILAGSLNSLDRSHCRAYISKSGYQRTDPDFKSRKGSATQSRALCVLIDKPCSYSVSSSAYFPGLLIQLLQQDVTFLFILREPGQKYGIKNENVTSLHYPCCNIGTSMFIPATNIYNVVPQ